MDYSKRILKKDFFDKGSKDAYMKVCRYLAENVISNADVSESISYTISKGYDEEKGLHKFTLELYAKINETDVLTQHCKICKETHSSFFISEETNCNWCKINALQRRIEDKMKIKQKYIKEKMKNRIVR